MITLEDFPRTQDLLGRIMFGMEEALRERGSCTVEDGYALLDLDELAVAKERQYGQVAVRRLRQFHQLHKELVLNSRQPSRHGGYEARWVRS